MPQSKRYIAYAAGVLQEYDTRLSPNNFRLFQEKSNTVAGVSNLPRNSEYSGGHLPVTLIASSGQKFVVTVDDSGTLTTTATPTGAVSPQIIIETNGLKYQLSVNDDSSLVTSLVANGAVTSEDALYFTSMANFIEYILTVSEAGNLITNNK